VLPRVQGAAYGHFPAANASRNAAELPGWSASAECAPGTKGPRVPFVSVVSLRVPTHSEKPEFAAQIGPGRDGPTTAFGSDVTNYRWPAQNIR
jgi:hypothetical protein